MNKWGKIPEVKTAFTKIVVDCPGISDKERHLGRQNYKTDMINPSILNASKQAIDAGDTAPAFQILIEWLKTIGK